MLMNDLKVCKFYLWAKVNPKRGCHFYFLSVAGVAAKGWLQGKEVQNDVAIDWRFMHTAVIINHCWAHLSLKVMWILKQEILWCWAALVVLTRPEMRSSNGLTGFLFSFLLCFFSISSLCARASSHHDGIIITCIPSCCDVVTLSALTSVTSVQQKKWREADKIWSAEMMMSSHHVITHFSHALPAVWL